jgi:sarcosine oxidase subunit alpha
MKDLVRISVDGTPCEVPAGILLAAALLNLGVRRFRTSVTGEPRVPLCGMGICHECRVTVDGIGQLCACRITVRPGMQVETS